MKRFLKKLIIPILAFPFLVVAQTAPPVKISALPQISTAVSGDLLIINHGTCPTCTYTIQYQNLTGTVFTSIGGMVGISSGGFSTLKLADGNIYVGNGSNLAASVTMGGDATIADDGTLTLVNASVIGQLLTGYSSGTGVISAGDSILKAIEKLNGNIAAIPSAIPGGSDSQVQYNDSSAFGGITGATTDGTTLSFLNPILILDPTLTTDFGIDTGAIYGSAGEITMALQDQGAGNNDFPLLANGNGAAWVQAVGADSSVNLNLYSKGASGLVNIVGNIIDFFNPTGDDILTVTGTSGTTSFPHIFANSGIDGINISGTETNVGWEFSAKGNGVITFDNDIGAMLTLHTPTSGVAANYIDLAAALSGNPAKISAFGSDTNVTLQLVPQGSGSIQAVLAGGIVATPTVSGNDFFTLNSTAATLTNKTISGSSNTLTNIGTTSISGAAITLAKIQNATANNKLLGSGASGSGASYSEITLGTGLSISGTTLNSSSPIITAGSFSGAGTATTTFTVTIGVTEPGTTYKVLVTPTAALSAALFYVTNKTTTTFDVVYLAGLTGTVTFDWAVLQ